jgi:L-ribulose-5-phosphate 3-epimerase
VPAVRRNAALDIRERSLEIMEKSVELADRLGIRIIQLAGYDVCYEDCTTQSKELFLENLKQAGLMAGHGGESCLALRGWKPIL